MIVTKQQFIDALCKLATGDKYKEFDFHRSWSSGFVYKAIEEAGFIVVDKQALSLSLGKEAALRKRIEDLQKALKHFPKWRDWKDSPQKIFDWQMNLEKLASDFVREFEGLKERLCLKEHSVRKKRKQHHDKPICASLG